MSDKKLSLAAEAYLYGYPLVYCVQEIINKASKPDIAGAAPVNTFWVRERTTWSRNSVRFSK